MFELWDQLLARNYCMVLRQTADGMGLRRPGKESCIHILSYIKSIIPAGKDDVPYNVSWIKLDEGPILISNIIGCKNEGLYVGMRVKVAFDKVTQDITLPKFTPLK